MTASSYRFHSSQSPSSAPERRRWAPQMLKKELVVLAATAALLVIGMSQGAEPEESKFRGVVTYYLNPAKVMRVDEIVKDPEPGAG